MINRTFRDIHARFDASPLGAVFAPRKPRHPLAKLAVALLGITLLAVLLVFGVVIGSAMLAIGLARRVLGRRKAPRAAAGRVVDAEYRVVDKPAHSLSH